MSDLSNDTGAGGASASSGATGISNGSATPAGGDPSKTATKAASAAGVGGASAKTSGAGSPKPAGASSGPPAAGLSGGPSSAAESGDDIGGNEGVSRLRATIQKLEDKAGELRRWGVARQDDAREIVEDKPLVVVGAAFGVGLLLGILAARV